MSVGKTGGEVDEHRLMKVTNASVLVKEVFCTALCGYEFKSF